MRILFHYTHKQTLGHTTRSISLVKALCRHKAEVLILQGGLPQPFIRFPHGCKVLDISHPFDTRQSFQSYTFPLPGANRAKFVLKTAADFLPDVFITEFFPFGRLAYLPELLPTLRYLRKKGTRIMASIGYPLLIDLDRLEDKKFAALQKAIFAFYDNFLIHTPQELEDPYIQRTIKSPDLSASYASMMRNLKKRIIYTGYIFPEKIINAGSTSPAPRHSPPAIVVSRGGGAVYPELITLSIEALRLLDKRINAMITCGPATTQKEMDTFRAHINSEEKKHIFLTDLLADLDDHLSACKVSVSLCGYNTSVQLMRYATPSVIIPYQSNFQHRSTNDQIARAQLLKERFGSIILDHDTLTAETLANAIRRQISSPKPKPAPAEWFNGAHAAAHLITGNDPTS